jgi:putative addiction module component (TIGR02574 family)
MGRPDIDVKGLTPEERLALLEEIWDSLEPEAVPVTDAQRRELDRRLDVLECDRDLGIPWDEVLRQIRIERARREP